MKPAINRWLNRTTWWVAVAVLGTAALFIWGEVLYNAIWLGINWEWLGALLP